MFLYKKTKQSALFHFFFASFRIKNQSRILSGRLPVIFIFKNTSNCLDSNSSVFKAVLDRTNSKKIVFHIYSSDFAFQRIRNLLYNLETDICRCLLEKQFVHFEKLNKKFSFCFDCLNFLISFRITHAFVFGVIVA